VIENLDEISYSLRWRQARRDRTIQSVARQIKACIGGMPDYQAAMVIHFAATGGWQVDRSGTSFSTIRPFMIGWQTTRPLHVSQFLVYRPDREGD
jgi:hypothetical protein